MKSWILLMGMAVLSTPIGCVAAETVRGADLAWSTFEAEDAVTSGAIVGPAYSGNSAEREASGRRCVKLSENGQFITFKAQADSQGLVIRYSVPDSADGQGTDTTLSLFINNKLQNKLHLTSRYSHLYGDYPFNNQPSSGTPRNFWDEVRVSTTSIQIGDEIRLEKGADDLASEYLLDFIELESVPPALERPDDSLSVLEFGATANDSSDDHAAFVAAIAKGKAQGKSVWIPPGQFVIKGTVEVSDVSIRGAGMWYSTLVGVDDYSPANRVSIQGTGSNITLSDFAIIGKLNYRNDAEANDGIGGSFGTGSSIRNLWIEHTKAGAWLVNSDGLLIEGCRFRNTIADGINLCIGMRSTIVRNCSARGNGDDCFAMWPATYAKAAFVAGLNSYINCTAQLPFLAQGFSIYGGEDNTVENCQAIDIPYGAGLYASTTFPTDLGFTGVTTFKQISVVRAGDSDGAIGTVANLKDLEGLRFHDIEVTDSSKDGIRFTSMHGRVLHDTIFDRIRIVNAGVSGSGSAVAAAQNAVGSATMSNVTVVNAKTSGSQNNAARFELIQGDGNVNLSGQSATDRGLPKVLIRP